MQKSAKHAPYPWYREPYVWLLILLPASAVVAGFYTLHLAVVSDDGLVVDDYYKKGLEINQVLERDQVALAHGLQSFVRFNTERRRIQLQLLAGTDYVLPEQLKLKFAYSTRAGFDQAITLQRIDMQSYEAELPELIDGEWYVQLEGEDWRLTGSVKLPGTTQLVLRGNS